MVVSGCQTRPACPAACLAGRFYKVAKHRAVLPQETQNFHKRFRLLFAYTASVGYNKRREAREVAQTIENSRSAAAGISLGVLCADGAVWLNVACHTCPRRGRYRLTRLIDTYGPTMDLQALAQVLSSDCPNRRSNSIYRVCGIHFPDVKSSLLSKQNALK